jgi:hypothetical protein
MRQLRAVVSLVAAVALFAGVISACDSAAPPATHHALTSAPNPPTAGSAAPPSSARASAAQGSGALASPAAGQFSNAFASGSVAAATALLASSGIATVADESASTPMAAVTGIERMRFTQAQVRTMALQVADHGGMLGSALDSATTTPQGDVPVSYLLAAWVSTGTSSGAVAVRAAMGSQNWTEAPSVVFPAIALPLFVSDVVAATPAGPQSSSSTQSSVYRKTSSGSAIESVALRANVTTAPCTLVSGFIQSVINTVFNALTLTAPSGSGVGATIGGFFVGIWNVAVALAQQAVQGLIKAVTGPVVAAIQSVAGAVAVISEVASYLSPWAVKVTADPSSIAAGDSGSFTGIVDGGSGGADYPPAVTDCANGLGVTLPSLSAGGADATWSLSAQLQATDDRSVTLDRNASTTINFGSTKDSSADCNAPSDSGSTGAGDLTVTRPAVKDLQTLVNSMITTGLGVGGSVVGPIVVSILQPIVGAILAKLDAVTDSVGTGYVAITGQQEADTCSSSASASPSPTTSATPTAACLVGTWRTTQFVLDGRSIGGAGSTTTFNADGTGSLDYSGSGPVQVSIATYQYQGSETFHYVLTDPTGGTGSFTLMNISGDVSAIVTTQGGATSVPLPGDAKETGTWTCQGNVGSTTESVVGAGVTHTTDMTRIGN